MPQGAGRRGARGCEEPRPSFAASGLAAAPQRSCPIVGVTELPVAPWAGVAVHETSRDLSYCAAAKLTPTLAPASAATEGLPSSSVVLRLLCVFSPLLCSLPLVVK